MAKIYIGFRDWQAIKNQHPTTWCLERFVAAIEYGRRHPDDPDGPNCVGVVGEDVYIAKGEM